MTGPDETTCEQLSAWMDGALSPEEARFLERRLQHDPALRAKWERLQLASSCLRGHDLRPMPGLSARVAAALEAPEQPPRRARPWLGWAISASFAALAIALVPRMLAPDAAPPQLVEAPAARAPATAAPAPMITAPMLAAPTPGAADLVAERTPDPVPLAEAAPAVAAATPAVAGAATSPTEFPLAERSATWPRAGLLGADPAMAGYLVRHNEMANADALGGFVPYLDVVTAEETDTADAAPAAAAKPADDDQDGTR
jgi:hypothetical protein